MADKKQEWTITFDSDEIRECYPDSDLTDEEVAEVAQSIIDMFNSYFYEWVKA